MAGTGQQQKITQQAVEEALAEANAQSQRQEEALRELQRRIDAHLSEQTSAHEALTRKEKDVEDQRATIAMLRMSSRTAEPPMQTAHDGRLLPSSAEGRLRVIVPRPAAIE